MSNWKTHHANEANKALEQPLVKEVMQEFADNMRFELRGLPQYGLTKVALYAAQVARAQALGFDPELLRVSEEEADQHALRVAQIAAESGKPVWVIVSDEEKS
jgi:hypothetical protein